MFELFCPTSAQLFADQSAKAADAQGASPCIGGYIDRIAIRQDAMSGYDIVELFTFSFMCKTIRGVYDNNG
jgi:hypothetical protein